MPQLSGKRGAKPAERDLAAVLWRTKRRDNTLSVATVYEARYCGRRLESRDLGALMATLHVSYS